MWTRPDTGKLPDFLIIGAQKCGTTTLERNLARHPDVYMTEYCRPGSSREVHFFNDQWPRGLKWYRSLFREGMLCGEKTPRYMTRAKYMERIHRTVPHAKLIICLRDPIRRLISQVNMRRRRLPGLRVVDVLRDPEYVDRGYYHHQIVQHVLRYFPREQLHVVVVDEQASAIDRAAGRPGGGDHGLTVADPTTRTRDMMSEICCFLGLPYVQESHDAYWVGSYPPDFVVTDREMAALRQIYAEPNARFFGWLGRKIDTWELSA